MKRKFFIIILLILSLCYCSKKDSNNSDDATFTLEGTVYIDDVPTSNLLVEFGTKPTIYHPTWSEITRYTDQDGKYSFKETTGSVGSYGAIYRVRVKNPIIDFWTEYKSGTVPLGQTVTEDFKFYRE